VVRLRLLRRRGEVVLLAAVVLRAAAEGKVLLAAAALLAVRLKRAVALLAGVVHVAAVLRGLRRPSIR
jgi:hypothetical protein